MKNVFLYAIATSVFIACNSRGDADNESSTKPESASISKAGSDTANSTSAITSSDFSITEIMSDYLKLKNALTNDNAKSASEAGNALVAGFTKLETNSLSTDQKKKFTEISEDAKEHAEHIAANAGNIQHQREHFATLSKDVNDLISTFGTEQKLYQDFCPMYNDGKGAIWISETKEIKNPYYGSKMLTCGAVKKEF